MKTIGKAYLAKIKSAKNIPSEITAISWLEHMNIIKIYEYFEDQYFYYVIFEKCEQINISDYILNLGIISEKIVATLFKQVVSAIVFLHAHCVLHRNIKHSTVLMAEQGKNEVKLIGFSESKLLYESTTKIADYYNTFKGYLAPEVLDKYYGLESDMWSLGVLLYKLLLGTLPFKNNEKLIKEGMFPKGKEYEALSENARNLIESLLTVDCKKRITAKDALEHKWFGIIDSSEEVPN